MSEEYTTPTKLPRNRYDENTMTAENDIPVIDILNNWISDNAQLYPEKIFYQWIKGDIPPIILELR